MILTRWDGTAYCMDITMGELYTIISGPAALYSFLLRPGEDLQEAARAVEQRCTRIADQEWEVVR